MAKRTATPTRPAPTPVEATVVEETSSRTELVPTGGSSAGAMDVAAGLENQGLAMVHRSIEEIRGMITVAKQFPRKEDACRQKLALVCQNPDFAQDALYVFEVGTKKVTGVTIKAAKEVARLWTNMIYSATIIGDTADQRTLRCWAWDMEANVRDEQDVTFRKIVGRKQEGGRGLIYRAPTDVELRILTNSEGSRGIRNCILNLLPYDVRASLLTKVQATRNARITEDPEAFTTWLIEEFGKLHVPLEELEAFTGQPVRQSSTAQLDYLDKIRAGLVAGEATWASYVASMARKEGVAGDAPPKSAQDLRDRVKAKADGVKKKLAAGEKVEQPAEPPKEPAKKKAAAEPASAGVERKGDVPVANGEPPRVAPEGYSDPEPPIASDVQ